MNEEIKYKKKHGELYDTFGEWKKKNPNNPIAKRNYPDNEYLQVISAYRAYFDSRLSFDDELDLWADWQIYTFERNKIILIKCKISKW